MKRNFVHIIVFAFAVVIIIIIIIIIVIIIIIITCSDPTARIIMLEVFMPQSFFISLCERAFKN